MLIEISTLLILELDNGSVSCGSLGSDPAKKFGGFSHCSGDWGTGLSCIAYVPRLVCGVVIGYLVVAFVMRVLAGAVATVLSVHVGIDL
jgi:hypothetical protein